MRLYRDLPVLAKLLVPFAALLFVVGPAVGYVVVRDVTSRARTQLNEQLVHDLLETRSGVHDRELYLLEAANFSANIQGMAAAIDAGDAAVATDLLRSVFALKGDLDVLQLIDARGNVVASLTRRQPAAPPSSDAASPRLGALGSLLDGRTDSVARLDTAHRLVWVAVPLCGDEAACVPVGMAAAAYDVDRLLAEAAPAAAPDPVRIGMYGPDGRLLAHRGEVPSAAPALSRNEVVRQTGPVRGLEVATVFSPLQLQRQVVGTLAAATPAAPTFSVARRTAWWLVGLLVLSMTALFGIGVLLSRTIVRQIRALHTTSQALSRGQLDARAPVMSEDEIGQLTAVMNRMADELSASQRYLEARVEQRTEQVQRLLRERTEFFAGLSHEMRTPLAVILSKSKMRRDPRFRRRQGEVDDWDTVEASAQQLLDVVNEILELARAESGNLEIVVVDVDLYEVVTRMAPALHELASGSVVALDIDVPSDLPLLQADAARLREVLINLVDNAVKYTPGGGRVRVSATADDGTVEIAVSDTGVGIPPGDAERVFEPFYRVPTTRTQKGQASTGLGLAVTKRLVEAQNGTLDFVSRPGGGTTFTVRLPAARSTSPAHGRIRGRCWLAVP